MTDHFPTPIPNYLHPGVCALASRCLPEPPHDFTEQERLILVDGGLLPCYIHGIRSIGGAVLGQVGGDRDVFLCLGTDDGEEDVAVMRYLCTREQEW